MRSMVVAVLSLSLVAPLGCDDSDDPPPPPEYNVTGTWDVEYYIDTYTPPSGPHTGTATITMTPDGIVTGTYSGFVSGTITGVHSGTSLSLTIVTGSGYTVWVQAAFFDGLGDDATGSWTDSDGDGGSWAASRQ